MKFFATTPKGLELLLVEELRALGAEFVAEKLAGVEFSGELEVAYKACLWSRLANRILMPLKQIPASTPEELYAGVQTIEWDEHLNADATLLINFVSSQSNITHTLFGAQKVKDAIVDQLRQKYNTRPSVARDKPDVSINVYLHKNMATIGIDLSGESLHKRGIRVEHGIAPLKENLAAAILLRSGWKAVSAVGGTLIDPMCGSGTLLIEAAQMAANIAPGLSRDYFGFLSWKKHDKKLWEYLVDEAKNLQDWDALPQIIGYDADPNAIKIAFANIERAGMMGKIHVEKKELTTLTVRSDLEPGLILMNPPYGERLGEDSDLQKLYEQIGEKLKNDFLEWRAAIFTGNPELGKKMGLRARKHYALFNGAIPCQLLLFDVTPDWFVDRSVESANERRIRRAQNALNESDLHAVQMFVNRLQKNSKHIRRWAERENISCYRLYDADLPEYAVAIDKYEDFIIVKEYPAPKSIDKTKAERRLQQILAVLPQAMEISEKNIYLITRDRMERDKYSRFDLDKCQIVNESQVKYLINLRQENNDVGLSLQQRLYRSFVRTLTHDKHVLNLFSRSGATAVAAALGGAKSIMNVDESEFSLEWTKQNLLLNEVLNKKYEFIRANPVDWIETAKLRFDCIITELPESSHRVREEYHEFIKHIFRLLQPNGIMLLTSRDARFKFNFDGIDAISIEDLTKRLISADFSHNARANPCVLVRRIG